MIAVVRGDEVLRFDDPRVGELQAGDRLVCLCSDAALADAHVQVVVVVRELHDDPARPAQVQAPGR